MQPDPDICYAALLARDRRFDGWFFVGVSSTGIYCRPVCAVRSPMRRNCHFFGNAAAAERAGFRPCLRCRPELAPGHGVLDVSSRLAQAAALRIEEGFLNHASTAQLAARIGVGERHLRRIFQAEFGVSLLAYAQTQRLLLAKRLLTETQLPITAAALTAGFGSVRRFNAVFQQHYGLNPRCLRQKVGAKPGETLSFALAYRPPLAWSALLAFLAQRSIDGVECVEESSYARCIALTHGGRELVGWLRITHAPARCVVNVTLPTELAAAVGPVLARVRHLLDLGANPDVIDTQLGALAADQPGLRVPGAFDGFEIVVRAIVGQQISVANARRVLARMALRFGTKVDGAPAGLRTTFPRAAVFAVLTAGALQACGITRLRAQAIIAVAREVVAGRITPEPLAPLNETLQALQRIPGIGPWTAQYIAMRALAWPNALPEGDAVLQHQLGLTRAAALRQHASQWEPWRAYATLHLWRQHEETRTSCKSIGSTSAVRSAPSPCASNTRS